MFKFDKKSFIIAIIIFLIEVIIALYIKDKIIRPFVGDILVVIFIYYFIKAFINTKAINIAIFTLFFSFIVEILQYFNFVEMIGLGHNKAARIIIGTSFSWIDLLCYFVGFILLFFIDKDLMKEM
ncbi:ribosomal maturation YjgA family protein [Empedobacter falsenii]